MKIIWNQYLLEVWNPWISLNTDFSPLRCAARPLRQLPSVAACLYAFPASVLSLCSFLELGWMLQGGFASLWKEICDYPLHPDGTHKSCRHQTDVLKLHWPYAREKHLVICKVLSRCQHLVKNQLLKDRITLSICNSLWEEKHKLWEHCLGNTGKNLLFFSQSDSYITFDTCQM